MQIPDEAVHLAAEAIMDAQNANDGEPERFEATLLRRCAPPGQGGITLREIATLAAGTRWSPPLNEAISAGKDDPDA